MIYNLGCGFHDLGHEVTLVAAAEYKPVEPEEYAFDVVYIPSVYKKILPPSVLPFQPGLWRYLKKNRQQFDRVISSEVFSFPSLFSTMLVPEKTIIWQELAIHNRKMKGVPSYTWYNFIARFFFRKMQVVPRSENAQRFIRRYLPRVADTVVEHGIHLQKFNFSREKNRQFIVVSQLILRKNIESILAKFSRFVAMPAYTDFRLIIAGRGALENELRQQAVHLGIINKVEFAGFTPHSKLNGMIAASMALLIDTRQDNNMVSIPESVVSGTPVVTNMVPTNAPVIKNNKLGIAKQWDEQDLKEIADNNAVYVDNCIAYRQELSATTIAAQLLACFKSP